MPDIDTKLIQTRVPTPTHKAAADLAARAGVSLRTWLKQLVAREVHHNGLGKRLK
jgi:predicted HicB family RNase H-like nuclease